MHHHHMTVKSSHHQWVTKTTNKDEDDHTSEDQEDGFSDVSSVDSLPKHLQNRMMEFNSWCEDNNIESTRTVTVVL